MFEALRGLFAELNYADIVEAGAHATGSSGNGSAPTAISYVALTVTITLRCGLSARGAYRVVATTSFIAYALSNTIGLVCCGGACDCGCMALQGWRRGDLARDRLQAAAWGLASPWSVRLPCVGCWIRRGRCASFCRICRASDVDTAWNAALLVLCRDGREECSWPSPSAAFG